VEFDEAVNAPEEQTDLLREGVATGSEKGEKLAARRMRAATQRKRAKIDLRRASIEKKDRRATERGDRNRTNGASGKRVHAKAFGIRQGFFDRAHEEWVRAYQMNVVGHARFTHRMEGLPCRDDGALT